MTQQTSAPTAGYDWAMLSPANCRTLDPSLRGMSDTELALLLKALYALGHLAFDVWLAEKHSVSKSPLGSTDDRKPSCMVNA